MLIGVLTKMFYILVLCPALLAAEVLTLSIDSQLGTSIEDCFERVSIGEQLSSSAIYRNVTELTTKECEQICKQDKQCQTFSYGVGAKGNASCDLSKENHKDIQEKKLLNRHPDYDLYIRRIQCEQSPPTPFKPLQDEPFEGPGHRPVFRPEIDERPLADYPQTDLKPFETSRPDLIPYRPSNSAPVYNNHLNDRPDDYNNPKPDYDRPPSYGAHKPQEIPYRPERPEKPHYPNEYDILQFQDQYGTPPRPYNPINWRPDPYFPPHPEDVIPDLYGANKPRPVLPYLPDEKPQYHYITRPNRKPRPDYNNKPQDYLTSPENYGSGPIEPESPYRPSRPSYQYPYKPHEKPTYNYNSQYASGYGQNQDNSIYLEIYDPPRPYKPVKDRPSYGVSNYGNGESHNSQHSGTQYYGTITQIDNSYKPTKPENPNSSYGPQSSYYGSQSSGFGSEVSKPHPYKPDNNQGSYGSHQDAYGSNQGYHGTQSSYGGSQNNYGSQSQYGTSQASYGVSIRPTYGQTNYVQSSYGNGPPQSSYTEKPIDDKPYGNRPDNSYDNRPSYTEKPHEKPVDNRPSYGPATFDDKPYDIKPGYDDKPSYNRPSKPYEDYRPDVDSGSSQPSYGSSQSSYGSSQSSYGSSQSSYSDNKPYGSNKPSYGSNEPSYSNKPNYGSSQPSYGSQSSYGSEKPFYGSERPSYGSEKPSYGSDRPTYGSSQSSYGNEQPSYSSNQGSYNSNQGSYTSSSQNYGFSGYGTEDYKNTDYGLKPKPNRTGYWPEVKPVYEYELEKPSNVPSYVVRPNGQVITSRPVAIGDYGKPSYGREPDKDQKYPEYGRDPSGYGKDPPGYGNDGSFGNKRPGMPLSYKACYRRVLAGRRALRSFVRRVIHCEVLEDCRRECATEKRFHCESFNYRMDPSFRGKGLCELMTKPIEEFDIRRDFVDDKDYDFYEVDRNSLEPHCPETLRGPGLLHSGFLSSKPGPEEDQTGWRDRNDWGSNRYNNMGHGRPDKWHGRRRHEDYVPYQIGVSRSGEADIENWGKYGGLYGGYDTYYKDRNDFHKSVSHWGLRDYRPPDYGVKPHGVQPEFNYNNLGRKGWGNYVYGYGAWKKGRWNTSGISTGNGLDYGESTYYRPPLKTVFIEEREENTVKDCSSRRRSGMSLGSGAIRRALFARTVVGCEAACFNEREFKCVSYSYRYSTTHGSDNCFLSERPYRGLELSADSGSDVYAMPQEQGCAAVNHKPWVESECFWHVRSGAAVSGSGVRAALTVAGLGACEAECIRAHAFFCRGFSFRFEAPTIGDDLENCILTSSPPTSLETGHGLRPNAGHELYARGNYGRGCEPALYDDVSRRESGECYLQYDSAAKLIGAAVRGQALVRDEQACGAACTNAPFRCLSFSYNNNAPPGTDNCLLSEIRLFDLQRGVDYEHSTDDWLFAFDLFNGQCWKKVHGKGEYEEPVPEIPRPISRPVPPAGQPHSETAPSGPPALFPATPDEIYIPGSGPPSGPGYKPSYPPSKPAYPPSSPEAAYPEPSGPGFKPGYPPSEPTYPGHRPSPDGFKPGYPTGPSGPNYPPAEPPRYKPSYPPTGESTGYKPSYPTYPSGPGFKPSYPPPEPSYPGVRPSGPGYPPEPSGPGIRPAIPEPIGPLSPGYPGPAAPKPEYGPPRPGRPGYPADREEEPIAVSWRHYTVSGFPCRKGTSCAQNQVAGHWACEPEGGEIGSWDYCCAPTHRCGYSEGFHKPWCYVGPSEDQWRPCSEKYYPYHQHNVPHPSQGHRGYGPPRPWQKPPIDRDGPAGPYLPDGDKKYWDDLYKNGPQAYYDKYGNPLPGYSRVPMQDRPHIRYHHNPLQPGGGSWLPAHPHGGEIEPPVPGGLGVPRYWPVAYLHKGPPPNMTYFRYNETDKTKTTTEKYDRRPETVLRERSQPPAQKLDPEKPKTIDNKNHRDEKTRKLTNATEDFYQTVSNMTQDDNNKTTTAKYEIRGPTTEKIIDEKDKLENKTVVPETESVKSENVKVDNDIDKLKGIDDKIDDFSSSIEVLDIKDVEKGDKIEDLKTLEAEERQIEAIGRLLASRRGGKLVLEKRSQKDLEAKSIAVDKDLSDFNFGNRFPSSERKGTVQRVTKHEIEKERNVDKSLEVSETTFVRPPRVLSTTENIRKAIVNGKVFYDATIREQRDSLFNTSRRLEQRNLYLNSLRKVEQKDPITSNFSKKIETKVPLSNREVTNLTSKPKTENLFSNSTRKPKFRHLEELRAPSVIQNAAFGKKKNIRARNVNPVRKVRRVYRRKYNPDEVRRRLLERERSMKEDSNKKML